VCVCLSVLLLLACNVYGCICVKESVCVYVCIHEEGNEFVSMVAVIRRRLRGALVVVLFLLLVLVDRPRSRRLGLATLCPRLGST
jgi:hypothetical protein